MRSDPIGPGAVTLPRGSRARAGGGHAGRGRGERETRPTALEMGRGTCIDFCDVVAIAPSWRPLRRCRWSKTAMSQNSVEGEGADVGLRCGCRARLCLSARGGGWPPRRCASAYRGTGCGGVVRARRRPGPPRQRGPRRREQRAQADARSRRHVASRVTVTSFCGARATSSCISNPWSDGNVHLDRRCDGNVPLDRSGRVSTRSRRGGLRVHIRSDTAPTPHAHPRAPHAPPAHPPHAHPRLARTLRSRGGRAPSGRARSGWSAGACAARSRRGSRRCGRR